MNGLYSDAFNKLMEDEQFVQSMLSKETPEQVQVLYSENGVELTIEDVNEIGNMLNSLDNNGELDESSLDSVSGGVVVDAALCWATAKAVIAVGGAGLAVYKWYKSR